jgi:hypothetical protein
MLKVLILTASIVVSGAPAFPQDLKSFSVVDEQQIRQAVVAFRQAVLKGDVKQILAQISAEGLTCTDSKYSYKVVVAFLSDHQSHLYVSLFDSPDFSGRCGGKYPVEHPAISDQEFLRTANDSIRIVRIAGNWAGVTVTSPNPQHYPREWSFHREGADSRRCTDAPIPSNGAGAPDGPCDHEAA